MNTSKLAPASKTAIWGGTHLIAAGKASNDPNCLAETWELSFHEAGPCTLADTGERLMDVASKEDLGSAVTKFPRFPVLVKLIDAKENLSVQVHPSDEYALKHEGDLGKTEMWHIIAGEPGCGLYVGLKKDSSKEEVEKAVQDGTIMELLNFFEVKPGESYFIPSGTIHAIGKGVTLIEIQQSSNVTYRLYDYKRVGKDGKERELHLAKALQVIDYKVYNPASFEEPIIGECAYFRASLENALEVKAPATSFASITFLKGKGKVDGLDFQKFDTFFIPAGKTAYIEGNQIQYVKVVIPE